MVTFVAINIPIVENLAISFHDGSYCDFLEFFKFDIYTIC